LNRERTKIGIELETAVLSLTQPKTRLLHSA